MIETRPQSTPPMIGQSRQQLRVCCPEVPTEVKGGGVHELRMARLADLSPQVRRRIGEDRVGRCRGAGSCADAGIGVVRGAARDKA